MEKEYLYKAMGEIRESYIEEAHGWAVKKKPKWAQFGIAAAGFALLIALPLAGRYIQHSDLPGYTDTDTTRLPLESTSSGQMETDTRRTLAELHRPYREVMTYSPNMAVAWRWEYLTIYEKFMSIEIDGVKFVLMGGEISPDVIGDRLGRYEAIGDNAPYETPEGGYRAQFDAYAIENVSPAYMVALEMEGAYYSFISEEARGVLRHASFGELMTGYGLDSAIEFRNYTQYRDGRAAGYYSMGDDAYIWEILRACADAPAVSEREWTRDSAYVSFTVTSDVLGIYKKALYVTEDGYLWTNMLEVACLYHIGEEAAGKILAYAGESGQETAMDPYYPTVIGTVTAITEEEMVIDDSVLCERETDGAEFRILLNDLRIHRYVADHRVQVGDLVQITFTDAIDTADGYVIDSAISADQVIVADGHMEVPE